MNNISKNDFEPFFNDNYRTYEILEIATKIDILEYCHLFQDASKMSLEAMKKQYMEQLLENLINSIPSHVLNAQKNVELKNVYISDDFYNKSCNKIEEFMKENNYKYAVGDRKYFPNFFKYEPFYNGSNKCSDYFIYNYHNQKFFTYHDIKNCVYFFNEPLADLSECKIEYSFDYIRILVKMFYPEVVKMNFIKNEKMFLREEKLKNVLKTE